MKKRIYMIFGTLAFIVLLSNLPPLTYLISYVLDEDHYRYSNADGSFTYIQKRGDIAHVEFVFSEYIKDTNPSAENRILFRHFRRNILAFWRYHDYMDLKYNLPYRNWKEIKRIKKKTISSGHKKNWMKF